MPNKTIYVSDDDLPLLDRAQEVTGDSLSATIVTALRQLVELREGAEEGWDLITVRVGPGRGRKQRFLGTSLGEWYQSDKQGYEVYRVYRTRRGRLAVHHERSERWTNRSGTADASGWRAWIERNFSAEQAYSTEPASRTLTVVDTIEEVEALLPADLVDIVRTAAAQPEVEDLDI